MGTTEKICCHPEYKFEAPKYREIADFIDGDVERVKQYLVEYDSELGTSDEAKKALASRKRRLTNDNECSPPLAVHIGHLAQIVTYGEFLGNDRMKAILDDVSGYELSAADAFAELLRLYLAYGKCGVLVDGPSVIGDSQKQAEEQGERSYQIIYEAQHIIDWTFFRSGPRKGKLAEIVLVDEPERVSGNNYRERFVKFSFPDGTNAPQGQNFIKTELRSLKEFTLSGLYTFNSTQEDSEYEVVQPIYQGDFDEIPFVLIGRGLKDSWFRDVAAQNKFLMNNYSVLDNVLWYQGYQRTMATGCNPDQIKSLAENQIVCIDNENADVKTIEAGSPDGLFRRIDKREARLRRIAMREFNRVVSDASLQESSASSKAMDSRTREKSYNRILDLFTKKLTAIYRYHAAYEGYKPEFEIKIARDFGLDDPQVEGSTRGLVFSRAGQLGVRELQQQILKQDVQELRVVPMDKKSEDETRKDLMKAIDAAKDPLEKLSDGTRAIFG